MFHLSYGYSGLDINRTFDICKNVFVRITWINNQLEENNIAKFLMRRNYKNLCTGLTMIQYGMFTCQNVQILLT